MNSHTLTRPRKVLFFILCNRHAYEFSGTPEKFNPSVKGFFMFNRENTNDNYFISYN